MTGTLKNPGVCVCIAVPTYRRPECLDMLLKALAQLIVPAHTFISVAVLDNDPSSSALATFQRFEKYPFDLQYVCIPEPGLSSVRNAALDIANSAVDFLAMIDDDEIPERQWLSELLRVCHEKNADAVIGPVCRVLPPSAPRWLATGDFFNDASPRTDGSFLRDGYSGNCLLRMASIVRFRLRFDCRMNFTGGEDVLFFRKLIVCGGNIVHARYARANERVCRDRISATYIIFRNLRTGNTLARCDRMIYGWPALALRITKGLAMVVLGAGTLAPNILLRGISGAVRSTCEIVRGIGMLLGVVGIPIVEYGRHQ